MLKSSLSFGFVEIDYEDERLSTNAKGNSQWWQVFLISDSLLGG